MDYALVIAVPRPLRHLFAMAMAVGTGSIHEHGNLNIIDKST